MRSRVIVLAALVGVFGGCWVDATGPGQGQSARLSFVTAGNDMALSVVPVSEIGVRLTRTSGDVALDSTIALAAPADSTTVDLVVPLQLTAPGNPPREAFVLHATLTDTSGAPVFVSGPDTVVAIGGGALNPIGSALRYVGPGASAVTVNAVPDTISGITGDTVVARAIAFDAAGDTVPAAPVVWTSLDTALAVLVAPDSGMAILGPGSGVGALEARLLTGGADTVYVDVRVPPLIALDRSTVAFSDTVGGTGTAPQVLNITNGGGGQLDGLSVGPVSYGPGASGWLQTTLSGATAPATLGVSTVNFGLAAGVYTATFDVRSSATASSRTVSVTFRVGSQALAVANVGTSTCALDPVGDVYCWGYGSENALADSTVLVRTAPALSVSGLSLTTLRGRVATFCGIDGTGVGYCWGRGGGKIGDGSAASRVAPTQVTGGPWAVLSPGWFHTCGVDVSGTAYCWGSNGNGELGNGSTTNSNAPVPVSGGIQFSEIRTGDQFSCGIDSGGQAWCWGSNDRGQLGNGSTTPSSVPVAVSGGLTFQDLALGNSHACGLDPAGAAYCWGLGGNVGDGSALDRSTPAPVAGGHVMQSISVGVSHSCGVLASGGAVCWGSNGDGRLGDGSTAAAPVPVTVATADRFVSIEAGAGTCGITDLGSVLCWGLNQTGQLGNGDSGVVGSPRQVSTPATLTSISTGDSRACGLQADSTAVCWGDDRGGWLGIGGGIALPSTVGSAPRFGSLSVGLNHQCGLDAGGSAYCWGRNSGGQLGDGSTTSRSQPTPVSGGLTFQSLAVGDTHTCGLDTGGQAYCWGSNASGELGDGSTADRAVPAPVSGGLTFASLTAGSYVTCGVAPANVAYCWGAGLYVGDGTGVDRSVPTPVSGGLSFTDIDAGNGVCALTPAGAAYCWGTNNRGRLGTGTQGGSASSPVAVTGGITFASISVGSLNTCGVDVAGSVYCWGDNQQGSVGQDTRFAWPFPALVSSAQPVASVDVGYFLTCAVDIGGVPYCWGDQTLGGLGDGTLQVRSLLPEPVLPW